MVFNMRKHTVVVFLRQGVLKPFENRLRKIDGKHLCDKVPYHGSKGYLSKVLDEIVKWYDEFTGMDEVRKAQQRVLEEERNFRNAQDVRRNLLTELNELHRKIKEIYAELDSTSRGEDKYINLVTLEHKLLKEEKAISEKFALAEAKERDSFTMLSHSVKLSHDQERAQRERTKYWSIVGSVLGTILGIVGTSINNHFKMNELRQLIKDSSDPVVLSDLKALLVTNNKFLKVLETTNKELNASTSKSHKNNSNVESLMNSINSRLGSVETKLNAVELNSRNHREKLWQGVSPIEPFTQAVKNELQFTNMILAAVAVLTILVPIFTRSS